MEETLKRTMAMAFQVDPSQITPEADPKSIPAWDSAAHVRLILSLEQQFGIQFDDDEVAEMVSFGAIAQAIQRHKS